MLENPSFKEREKISYLRWTMFLVMIVSCMQGSDAIESVEAEMKVPLQICEAVTDFLETFSYPTENPDQWTLIWNDEFHDKDSLENWDLQDWASFKLNEWQYYTPENVKVNNDILIIESKKERFKGREFTSGAITTENKFEFTYGKIEVKAKLPRGQGVFPAIWLVNSKNDDWLPEIDIMENLGQKPDELWFVVHWKDSNGKKMRDYFHYKESGSDFSKDFHVYGVIWEEDKISWTVDGAPVFETVQFSPDKPLFLYINTAIGGEWPGNPDPLDEYPKELLIDYVRIYSK